MRSSWRLLIHVLVLSALVVLAACGATPARSQQSRSSDPRHDTRPTPIVVQTVTPGVIVAAHTVDAVVEGRVAQVQVTQVFRNQSRTVAEGVYIFPLPKDAAVSDFQMTVNGEVLEGKLLDRDEARRIYEQIVRSQRDPALLEYLDRGLFQASVFPIPPGETRTVDFSYSQVLAPDGNLLHFNYPLSTERFSTAPVEEVAVTVELLDQPGLRTIYSPNYPITIERTAEDRATAVYTASDDQPAGDFDLYWGVADEAIGLDLLSYKPAGEDGFFVLLAAPGVAATDEVVARDIVVVLDVSGSMRGPKMEQAVDAVRYIVENLNAEDRFNLITFSTGVSLWESDLQPADGDAIAAALDWLADAKATGSTDINRALLEALAQLDTGDDDGRPAYVLFLTDGQPTQGEQDAGAIVRNALNNLPAERTPRLFTFGLGYDVNTDLLDTLATDLRGRSQYVRPDEPIDEAVSDFYATVSTPVLADLAVDFGPDAHVEELYPFPLPDLFAGQQLVVAGRYRDGGPVEVTLSGQVNGEERLFVYPDRELVERGGDDFVARLWATRKIGYLLAEIRRSGPEPELVEAVTELSLRYGIVTPYTSYLVLEPNVVAMPAGDAMADRQFFDSARVYERGAQAAQEMAAAPAAGEAAVAASQARSALQEAETVREQAEQMRFVAGRSFAMQSLVQAPDGQVLELWVDQAYTPGMRTTTIEFGSDAYFALLDEPGMAEWLALSPELIVVTGEDEAIRVTVVE
ncbi:MAG: VWA domain-containing protein [Caldilinea sp.]|nr:VWA domain-containing protein [Caldilinea sp.]MCW5845011.1 VWA domain-containing protein [Caldilinea sp.]